MKEKVIIDQERFISCGLQIAEYPVAAEYRRRMNISCRLEFKIIDELLQRMQGASTWWKKAFIFRPPSAPLWRKQEGPFHLPSSLRDASRLPTLLIGVLASTAG